MKISIIIPLYNQGGYIREAIESCLNQTVKPHEIIVINDGSTDGGEKIVEEYKEVKLINQVNKGLSSARNTGIMNATGDWILPLDGDDILRIDTIEKIQKAITETDKDIIALSMRCFGVSNGDVILMQEPTIEDFKIANRIPYCSAIKKELLLACGGYSPRMFAGYEDYHLWFDLLSRGAKIYTIQEPLMLYRTKEKSMIHDALKNHVALMEQIRKDFPQVTNIVNNPLPR